MNKRGTGRAGQVVPLTLSLFLGHDFQIEAWTMVSSTKAEE